MVVDGHRGSLNIHKTDGDQKSGITLDFVDIEDADDYEPALTLKHGSARDRWLEKAREKTSSDVTFKHYSSRFYNQIRPI